MKKHIILLMVLAILMGLVVGCGGVQKNPDAVQDTPVIKTDPPDSSHLTESGGQEEGLYNLAVGKYEVDENGVPLEPYEYQLPLSTSDEVFTYLTSPVLVDAIPELGYEDLPYPLALLEKTGVILEYILIHGASRVENMSIALASDDLPDLITNIDWYYPGPLQSAVDDGYIANLYEYKEYMPNYYYIAHAHPEDINVQAKIVPYPETIYAFYCMESEYVTRNGMATRGDWLDRLGMTNDDIITIDDLHSLLMLYKTEIGASSPFLLYNSLDPHSMFSAFDTIASVGAASIAHHLL